MNRKGTPELVTLGETMGTLTAHGTGPLANGATLRLGCAGAESTVAIGVSRLGHPAAWIGRVGDDPVGEVVLSSLRAEGVDLRCTHLDASAPTGLMLRERRTSDHVRGYYYRADSAGSHLSPEDIDSDLVAGARILHITGITPALSDSASAAVRHATQVAHDCGVLISFDVNYRAALWSPAVATDELETLVQQADIVFAGVQEAALFVPDGDPADMGQALLQLGPREVVIKLGSNGALAVNPAGVTRQSAISVTSVDPIGAGDAFVSGYLAAVLDSRPIADRLALAAACGAFGVATTGDWDGLPHACELALITSEDVVR